MATIHQATDICLEREVAVKLLRPEVSRDRDLAQRFRREALAATVLRHPNIVPCLDSGTDGDQPYLVMDLIEGEDLAARLKRSGRLAPWQVARIGLDVARALGVAHVRGIVHRDIKPGNILLAADGRAMVTDFGIARLAIDAEASMPGTTLGSVHYFSPEQARGATTTPASDVYGLGLVMYEALTGVRAWSGDSTDAIALARIGASPPSPRATAPDVPAALEAVVMRAMAPEAGDRYPNGAAVAAALEAIAAAADPRSPTVAVPARAPASPAGIPSAPLPSAPDVAVPPIAPPVVPPGSPRAPAAPAPAGALSAGSGARTERLGSRSSVAVVALALAGLLVGGILVAALPGAADVPSRSEPPAAAGPTAAPTRDPTPEPTATPAPDPTATPDPTPEPTAVPTGEVADLCESFFGLPCGLGPGRYAPSRFDPSFDMEIGEGWSTALHDSGVAALVRDEGFMTFASAVTEVYPSGGSERPRDRVRDLIEAFIATEGVSSTRPANLRLDGRKGQSVDLTPTDGERVALFATASSTYYLEPERTTRVVAVDVKGQTVLIAIEPADGYSLRDILDTADVAAGTIRWR
jgi:eukaryotic-like serine/threonine-protein kinase